VRRPRDERDAARNVARSLTGLAARLAPVEAEAESWLDGADYRELRRSLENARAAVEEAASEARRAVMRGKKDQRRDPPTFGVSPIAPNATEVFLWILALSS